MEALGGGGGDGGGKEEGQTSAWLLANPHHHLHLTPLPLPVAKFFNFAEPFPAILGILTLQFVYKKVHIIS